MKANIVLTAVVVAFSFISSNAFALTSCQKLFVKYQNAHGHKAFATPLGNDPGYHPTSCSFISDFSIKRLAENKAIANCNTHRRPEDGGRCKVISSQ